MLGKNVQIGIGWFLVFDAIISLYWGITGDSPELLNNSLFGNFIRIVRLIFGLLLIDGQ